MVDMNLDDLIQRALAIGILTPQQIQEMWVSMGTQNADASAFVQETLRKGFLTNYQAELLGAGETKGFFFGEYKVLYHVGAGTFARVYRATHRDTGKIVAVKVLRSRFYNDPEIINHFVHEAELGIELRHPNIVPIYEVKSEPNLHYMVMDFVEGQTLREFLRIRKKIEPKLATRIVVDVCSGLDYAAKRGLLHRDLKLSNVLLSSMQRAMLVDFGLAAIAENAEIGNAEIRNQRSIDYAALERTTGTKRDDSRSDIYFLGCIYYHLLTGEPALLETKDRNKRLDKNRFYNVKPIQRVDQTIPNAVVLIVNKAMSMEVEKRYQSMGEMLTDLEICGRRLAEGTANDGILGTRIDQGLAQSAPVVSRDKQRSVMIVDSNTDLQTFFRNSLKKAGYRVLVASSADRAVDRLLDDISVADLVLFNAQSLGETAVRGFNKLAEDDYSKNLPLIVLLDEKQAGFIGHLHQNERRVALSMPITMKVLKENITKLMVPHPETQWKTNLASTAPQAMPSWLDPDFAMDGDADPLSLAKRSEAEAESAFFENILQSGELGADDGEAGGDAARGGEAVYGTPSEQTQESGTDDHIFEEEDGLRNENREDSESDDESDLDEEEDRRDRAGVTSFGYKEMLQDRDDQADPIADALFDANVPALIKAGASRHDRIANGERTVPEQIVPGETVTRDEFDEEPQNEPGPPESSEPPKSLDELRDAINKARLAYAAANREELDVSRQIIETKRLKTLAEEAAKKSEEHYLASQRQRDDADRALEESTIALESIELIEVESQVHWEEAARAKLEAETELEETRKVAEEIQLHAQTHEEIFVQSRQEAAQSLSKISESEEKLNAAAELQLAMGEAFSRVETLEREVTTLNGSVAETKTVLERMTQTLDMLQVSADEANERTVEATLALEAAIHFASETKEKAGEIQQKADEAMERALEMEKLAEQAEEEARRAAERAAKIREDATTAMIEAGDTRLRADGAAEEARTAELFVEETRQKLEDANMKEELAKEEFRKTEEEKSILEQESREKFGEFENKHRELKQVHEEWEAAKSASETADRELAAILDDAETARQVQDHLSRLDEEHRKLQEAVLHAEQAVETAKVKLEETIGYEAESRANSEKLTTEARAKREEFEETARRAEEFRLAFEESHLAWEKATAELHDAVRRDEQIGAEAKEKAAAKEAARSVVETAQKALSEFLRKGAAGEGNVNSETGFSGDSSGSVEDRVAAAIRARVEAALAARKSKTEAESAGTD